jgi:CRP-like cAMP-binding protein
MPLDWLNTPLDADIGELLARKKRAKAIETLRRQLQGRLAPPVTVRLQLADLLMQAGRGEEAVPVLLGLADEFAADGFVAKAVAILKRVDRAQPGRADVSQRLERLVHQQKQVALPARPRSAVPEFGIEELGQDSGLSAAEAGLTAEVGGLDAAAVPVEGAPSAPPETQPAGAAGEPMETFDVDSVAGAVPTEAASDERAPDERMVDSTPQSPEDPGLMMPEAMVEPMVEPTVEALVADALAAAEPEPPSSATAEPTASAADAETGAESPESPTAEGGEAGTAAGPGVGRRIRRALWRFLASLPGADEPGGAGAPPPTGSPDATLPPAGDSAVVEAIDPSTIERIAGDERPPTQEPAVEMDLAAPASSAPPAVEPEPSSEIAVDAASERGIGDAVPAAATPSAEETSEPEPDVMVDADDSASGDQSAAAPMEVDIEFEPPPAPPPALTFPLAASESDPALSAAGGEDAMSEDTFRDHLLDIVEDVLHRTPPPEQAQAVDRARVLDLARRLVASRLFQDLSDEELLAILRGLKLRTYEPGDVVVTEGEIGHSLFTITSGHVKVFIANPDGRNFEVNTLSEGDFFGEISSLSGRPRSATVVAATACELLELDRPTLDGIARTHARVREVLESAYIERASSPEAAAVRAVSIPESGSRRKAIEVLEAHFGETRWDPRMRLRLADVLLKAGKHQDAIPILVGLADELAREGFADKAVAILKKIEQVQRRNVEVVNLAPLIRGRGRVTARSTVAAASAAPAAPGRRAVTDDKFHGWLVDLVRDTVEGPAPALAPNAADAPALKAYGPGLLANPMFEDFTEEELLAFIRGLKLLTFDPGDMIITEGEAGQSVFILATGRVKVFVRGADHGSVLLGALGEGAFFGEISTLSGRPRSATITAAAPCDILELDRAGLEALGAAHPRVRAVLKAFSEARSADPLAARARGARASD